MPNENRPPRDGNAGTGMNECRQRDYTTPRRHVKHKPARRITDAARAAILVLYGPPESNDQDGDESRPANADWSPCRSIEKERIGAEYA